MENEDMHKKFAQAVPGIRLFRDTIAATAHNFALSLMSAVPLHRLRIPVGPNPGIRETFRGIHAAQ